MNQASLIKAIVLSLTAILITACANTRPIGEWASEVFSGKLDNILIIAVTSRSTRQRVFEDRFVDALAGMDVKATPSYKLLTSSLQLSRQVVENAIRGQGMGAVLVTRIAGIKEKEVYRRPDDQEEYLHYFSFYDKALQQSNVGYYAQYRSVILETNLYDTRTGALVWSMQSETMDASQPRHLIEDQIKLTIETLAKRGLIGQ